MKRKVFVDYFIEEDALKRNKVNDENSTVYNVVQSYLTSPFHGQIDTNKYSGEDIHNIRQSSEDIIRSYSSYDTYQPSCSRYKSNDYGSSSSGSSSYSNEYGIHKRNNASSDYSKVSNSGRDFNSKYKQDNHKAHDCVNDSRQNNTARQYINNSRQNNYTTLHNNNDSAFNFTNSTNYRQKHFTTYVHASNIPNEKNHNASRIDCDTPYNFFKFKRAPYQSGRNLNYDPNTDDYNSHYACQIQSSSPSSNKNLESFLSDSISISIDILPSFSTLLEGYSKYIILLILLFVYKCTIS